jgi:hypothetical protein
LRCGYEWWWPDQKLDSRRPNKSLRDSDTILELSKIICANMLLHFFLKNLIYGILVLQIMMKSTCKMFQSHSPFSLSTCFPQTIVSLKKQWLMATPSTKVAQFPLHVRIQNQFVHSIYQTFLNKAIKKPKKAFWYIIVSINPSDFVPFLMFI